MGTRQLAPSEGGRIDDHRKVHIILLIYTATNGAPSVTDHKQQAVEFLKSIETGNLKPLTYFDPAKFASHNANVSEGMAGLEAVVKAAPKRAVKINTVRVFQDGDFVITHTEGQSSARRVVFDIFRFEDGKIVEHWDNHQEAPAEPNPSGHTMIDGPTAASDLDKTEANKALMRAYMEDLLQGRREKFAGYFDGNNYIQHNPWVADNLNGLLAGLQSLAKEGKAVKYDRVHMVLGEGDFVLVVAEGTFGSRPTSYYDLYRIQTGKIAEHWDTLESIPLPSEWKNSNGKF